jgi:hypothetical protein
LRDAEEIRLAVDRKALRAVQSHAAHVEGMQPFHREQHVAPIESPARRLAGDATGAFGELRVVEQRHVVVVRFRKDASLTHDCLGDHMRAQVHGSDRSSSACNPARALFWREELVDHYLHSAAVPLESTSGFPI